MITSHYILKEHVISQVEGNIVSDMDGEKVMLSIHNGKYYNLGQMGGEIWELIRDPVSFQQLITTLTYEYDVEQASCEKQVISFLEHLRDEGLIQIGVESQT